jgi:hypothetical protein
MDDSGLSNRSFSAGDSIPLSLVVVVVVESREVVLPGSLLVPTSTTMPNRMHRSTHCSSVVLHSFGAKVPLSRLKITYFDREKHMYMNTVLSVAVIS